MNGRQKLEQLSRNQEEEIEQELTELAEKGKHLATQALLIVGGLALSYMLFKAFDGSSGKSKKKKKAAIKIVKDKDVESEEEESSLFGNISTKLATEAALFLLAIAKDRLVDYLNNRNESAEGNTSKKSNKS